MSPATQAGRLGVRPVDLSSDDAFHFDRLARSLLDEALFEYDHFVTVDRRRVNPAQWRHWRQDDDVVLYRERHAGDVAHESLLDPEASGGRATTRLTAFHDTDSSRSKPKATPRLLAAGSLASALDDVLYGIVAPSAAAMRLKAAHLKHDDFLDGAVLAQIRTPTPSEPFQFLGIKWLLRRGMGGVLVRPRDFVFLEASGVQVRQDGSGQRVGFHIMHSVDVPQCSPQGRGASVQRGAFSMCSLYHELATGVVDVYMTALVQPRGNLLAPLAMRSAAAMLSSNWRALTLFAENKKLAWMLETHRQLVGPPPPQAGKQASRCGLCSKSFKGLTTKKSLACQLCAMGVCAHCSVTRTLRAEGFARDSIVATAMLFCKKCIALAGEENASEIARQQLWETEVVRTGRAHTQTALALVARREVNGSQYHQSFLTERALDPLAQGSLTAYRPTGDPTLCATLHETDPGTRRYRIFDDKTGDAHGPRNCGPSASKGPGSSRRRGTNGTWNDSARATDALSIGTMDYRSSSFQEPAPAPQEADRGSTATSALVLLDDRKSTRRMKALDYLPPVEASATEESSVTLYDNQSERASMATSSYTEVEVESVYSRSSFSSSIAVLDVDARRAEPTAKPSTITEEDEPRSELEAFYQQQLQIQQQLQQQSSMIPLHPYPPTQLLSSRVHFQDTRPSLEGALLDVRSSEILPPPSTSSTLLRSNSGTLAAERGSGEQRLSYQMQLWLQMNELRDTAESTYQIAQRNTEALASQNPKLFRDMRFFSQQPLRRTETSFAPASLGPAVGTYQFGRRTSMPTTREGSLDQWRLLLFDGVLGERQQQQLEAESGKVDKARDEEARAVVVEVDEVPAEHGRARVREDRDAFESVPARSHVLSHEVHEYGPAQRLRAAHHAAAREEQHDLEQQRLRERHGQQAERRGDARGHDDRRSPKRRGHALREHRQHEHHERLHEEEQAHVDGRESVLLFEEQGEEVDCHAGAVADDKSERKISSGSWRDRRNSSDAASFVLLVRWWTWRPAAALAWRCIAAVDAPVSELVSVGDLSGGSSSPSSLSSE